MRTLYLVTISLLLLLASCGLTPETTRVQAISSPILKQLVAAALEQRLHTTSYDPAYVKLDYPKGDVPLATGVCSDVVIRAFRRVKIDLQQVVHEDMVHNFAEYPQRWGLKKPDTNIDHRRVPNLMTYFTRQGKSLPITTDPKNYQPGDIVAWKMRDGRLHIGIVNNILSDRHQGFQIVHNAGWGAKIQDVLFEWEIIGHYRYFP